MDYREKFFKLHLETIKEKYPFHPIIQEAEKYKNVHEVPRELYNELLIINLKIKYGEELDERD